MNTATNVIQMLVRVSGLIQIVLGVLFWTDNALALIPVHMLNGFLLVLLLWLLAAFAARAGVSMRLVALVVVWGIIVPVLGLNQSQLLPGDFHWVIEVLHLLVGFGLMGLAQSLATRISQARVLALQR